MWGGDLMVELKKNARKKPSFIRVDWNKYIRLGRKKRLRWKSADGRHNKLRLGMKGHSLRPKIGWGSKTEEKNLISNMKSVRVENLNDLKKVGKGEGIIIAKVGEKKRKEIIAKANEMKIKILNRYRKNAIK